MAADPRAAALMEAYRAHREGLLRFCTALLRNREDAEDAVQETFARAASRIAAGSCEPAPYLYMVARNICRDVVRRHRPRQAGELGDHVVAGAPGPEDIALDRFALRQLWAGMTARDRRLLADVFAGFQYEEIARRSGISAKAVSVALVRARDRVRRARGNPAAAALTALAGWRRGLSWRCGQRREGMLRLLGQLAPWPAPGEALPLLVAGCLLCSGQSAWSPPSPAAVAGAPADMPIASGNHQTAGGGSVTTWRVAAATAGSTAPPSRAAAAHAQTPANYDDGNATTNIEAMQVDSVTPSPDYDDDHTLFAEGRQGSVVGRVFVSHDGGQTWRPLPAIGFAGGPIVLTPAWPADPQMFAGTEAGLQESDDGGATWRVVAPLPGVIAVAADPVGGYRVAIAGAALWTYQTTTRTLRRGPLLPPGTMPPLTALFAGDADHVVLSSTRVGGTTPDGVVLRCDLVLACSTASVLPGEDGARLVAPPGGQAGALLALGGQGGLYVSHDAGQSFSRLDTGGRRASALAAAVAAGASAAFAYTTVSGGEPVQRVAVLGATGPTDLPHAVPTHWTIGTVLLLPGGRVLAVQLGGAPAPVSWWSDDGGSTWQGSTAAPA